MEASATAMPLVRLPAAPVASPIPAGWWGITVEASATAMPLVMLALVVTPIPAGWWEGMREESTTAMPLARLPAVPFAARGGLVGKNEGSLSGKNYFVDDDGTNGMGASSRAACDANTCIQATASGFATPQAWLQDGLDESDDDGMGWSSDHWKNFGGETGSTGFGYPLLKYAQIGTCSVSPNTLTTQATCEAAGSCNGATASNAADCRGAGGTWEPTNTWLTACGGTTGITCGSTIANCGDDSPSGEGSLASPYLICNYAQLDKMNDATDGDGDSVPDALTKHYELVAHIDASPSLSAGTRRDGSPNCTAYDSDATTAGDAGHPSNPVTCVGWTPVGDDTTPFTGSLQGAGYTIRKLYINISTTIGTTRVGLFGQIGRAGVVQNVGLRDAFIRVDTANSYVGGLAGVNDGSISNSYAGGTVSATTAGGLVGSNSGSISNSYARGSANGGSSAGGLAGRIVEGSATAMLQQRLPAALPVSMPVVW